MRKFISIACILFAIPAIGQITLTNANMPGSSDTIRYSNALPAGLNYAATGANYSWDFSTLTPLSQGLYEFKPSSAINLTYSVFFGFTSYGLLTADTLNLGIFTLTDMYDFVKNTSSSFKTVGRGMEYLGLPVPANFDDDDEIYTFPLDYTDHDSTTFDVSFSLAATLELFMKGYRINDVEGWGTVQTPYGTYDCLKLVSTVYETDSFVVSGFPTPAIPRTTRSYKWLATSEKIPVLEIAGSMLGTTFIPTLVRYRDVYSECLANSPTVSFSASDTTGMVNDIILFSGAALCSNSFVWSITPTTFSYVNGTGFTDQNPEVQFLDTGWYSASLTGINGLGTSTDTKTNYIYIQPESGQGIGDDGKERIGIFPNPFSSQLNVFGGSKGNISIQNMLGQTLFSKPINPNQNLFVETSGWENGMYVIRFQDGYCRRIIKTGQ